MIKEVSGDILLSKAQCIAHGVAPNDNFAQGLALALRDRWPALYKDFRHYCHTEHPKEGGAWAWGGADGKRIVSLFTQTGAYDHGAKPGKAAIENVNHALKELHKVVEKEGYKSVALPKLATGVGGLDWNEVRPLIDKHLGSLKVPVLIYSTYRKDQQADEGI